MWRTRGSVTLYLLISLAGVALFAGLGWYVSAQSRTVADLEQAVKDKELEIGRLKDQEAILTSEKENLINTAEAQKALYLAAQNEIRLREQQYAALETKYKALAEKLPKPLTRDQEPAQTPQQEERARQRIWTVWEAFCLTDGASPTCQALRP